MLHVMLSEMKKIREESNKSLKPLEEEIEEAAITIGNRYLSNFCSEHEKKLKETSNIVKNQYKDMNNKIKDLLRYKTNINKEEFKNKLAVAILLLEKHTQMKRIMSDDVEMLKKLGNDNVLVARTIEALENDPELLLGLEDIKELNDEFNISIKRARLGAFIGQNKGFIHYCSMVFAHKLFGYYKFPKHLKEYMESNNTNLVKNLRNLSYLEKSMKEKRYEEAWNEIEELDVFISITSRD